MERTGQPATDSWDRASSTMPRRRVLADHICETIRSLLMDQVLEPGRRISIDDIARRLAVSPTPVREALSRLENEGLVTKRALSGFTATPLLDRSRLAELFELRSYMEGPAARTAALNRQDADLHDLREVLEGTVLPGDAENYESYREFAMRDAQFHDLIARAGGNVLLRDTLARLQPHTHVYRLQVRVDGQEQTLDQHWAILRAIEAQDATGAADAMHRHLENAHLRLVSVMEAARQEA